MPPQQSTSLNNITICYCESLISCDHSIASIIGFVPDGTLYCYSYPSRAFAPAAILSSERCSIEWPLNSFYLHWELERTSGFKDRVRSRRIGAPGNSILARRSRPLEHRGEDPHQSLGHLQGEPAPEGVAQGLAARDCARLGLVARLLPDAAVAHAPLRPLGQLARPPR